MTPRRRLTHRPRLPVYGSPVYCASGWIVLTNDGLPVVRHIESIERPEKDTEPKNGIGRCVVWLIGEDYPLHFESGHERVSILSIGARGSDD